MDRKDEELALFWCSLLHDVILKEIDPKEVNQTLKEIASKEYLMPGGNKIKPSVSTLRRKLNRYREGGIKALVRKSRSDKGKTRVVAQHVIDKAVELKKEQPKRSDETINKFLQAQYNTSLSRSTLYRHLRQQGATQLKLGVSKKKVRKRWTKDFSNAMWVGDFEHGPYIIDQGICKKTHLSLFIDCYSRYVVEAKYYLKENMDILIDSLLRAWSTHGTSFELYLDNAKIYHSNGLKSACYELYINLIHRPPKEPQSGGIVERMFLTIQNQFEAEVRAGDILTLEQLNEGFFAWLDQSYHQRIHRETSQSPQERYEQGLTSTRLISINQVIHFFMQKETRTVDKVFSDIRLFNKFYRVNPKLRGDKIQVYFDPHGDWQKVFIYAFDGGYLGEGNLYNREYGQATEEFCQSKPKNDYIKLLQQQQDKKLQEQKPGLDYQQLLASKSWPFTHFIQLFAKLLGRKGGASAFNTEECNVLQDVYIRYPLLNANMLRQAFNDAQEKNIVQITYQLQLLNERNT